MTLTPFLRCLLSYFGLAPGGIQSGLKKMILNCKFQILGIKTTVGHYVIIFSRNSSCLQRNAKIDRLIMVWYAQI